MAPPLLDDQIGFASISLPLTTYTQLPNIPCKEIYIGNNSFNLTVGGSATPGTNAVLITLNVAAAALWIMIPTGGNANNLFVSASAAGTLAFLWRNPRIQMVAMGV